jgi:hypothetical protein
MDAATPTDTGAPVQPPKRKRGRPPKVRTLHAQCHRAQQLPKHSMQCCHKHALTAPGNPVICVDDKSAHKANCVGVNGAHLPRQCAFHSILRAQSAALDAPPHHDICALRLVSYAIALESPQYMHTTTLKLTPASLAPSHPGAAYTSGTCQHAASPHSQNPTAVAAAAAAAKQQATPKAASPAQHTPTANEDGAQPAKRRGRPPGSKNRLCKTYGNPMVPQVVIAAAGEVRVA